ncbi:MAG: hypothetical protein M3Y59_02545 [Myxococcota bacterium]|nr:hypothetical protein [Myxococcota bacterium]
MKNLIKTSAAVITAALLGACSFDQATPPCAVGHGGYGAQYTHVSGNTSGACFRKGDIIGVQKYRSVDSDVQTVHLRPEVIGFGQGLPGVDEPDLTSDGELTGPRPGADGFCTAPSLSVATGVTNAGDYELSYAFSNVRFYVQGAVPGTQFTADLTISSTDEACSSTYTVQALYPVVFCNDFREATDNRPEGTGAPSEELCDEPDHLYSHYSANPLFDSTCNEVGNYAEDLDWLDIGQAWHLCTPTTAVPSLK